MTDVLLVVIFLAVSALYSGLTLGVMSLNLRTLKNKAAIGDKKAVKLLPLREKSTQLLISLVFGNVLSNALLTIKLDSLAPSAITIAAATILITVFTEILPQATIGRFGLKYAPAFVPFMTVTVWLFSPFAKPAARFLDARIGHELPTKVTRRELQNLVKDHAESEENQITKSESLIARQALTLSEQVVKSVMTPRRVIKAIAADRKLNDKTMNELYDSGYSRFPVYKESLENIVGTLYIRDLVKSVKNKQVSDVMSGKVYYVNESQSLDHVLQAFLTTKHHQYIVVNQFKETVGLITIEDVIEYIIGREIVGEFDKYEDLRAVAAAQAGNK